MAGLRPFALGAAALTLGAAAIAQQPQRPTFVSPEVLPDGRVITRLWAPSATEVLLSGDWMGPQPAVTLVKDSSGGRGRSRLPLQFHRRRTVLMPKLFR